MPDKAKSGADKFFYLIIMFMLVSFIGWCIETIYFKITFNDFTDRGFLTLPLCTVYGSSVILIYALIGTPAKGRLRPLFARAACLPAPVKIAAYAGLFAVYFAIAALLATAAEFVTGLLFDKVFGVELWSYSRHTHNLFGYICIEMSLVWGALITAAMGIIWPPVEKIVFAIEPKAVRAVAITFLICIAFDFIFNTAYLCINGVHFELY